MSALSSTIQCVVYFVLEKNISVRLNDLVSVVVSSCLKFSPVFE